MGPSLETCKQTETFKNVSTEKRAAFYGHTLRKPQNRITQLICDLLFIWRINKKVAYKWKPNKQLNATKTDVKHKRPKK